MIPIASKYSCHILTPTNTLERLFELASRGADITSDFYPQPLTAICSLCVKLTPPPTTASFAPKSP